jgi:predicted SAM-dependent methyltransferase
MLQLFRKTLARRPSPNSVTTNDLAARRRKILKGIDPANCHGLEIGPLNNPVVRKDEGPVRYVDFTDTESLKRKPYDASINPNDILNVDIVWGAEPLAQMVARPVDYVVAAHVIEHVPDIVGWLHDVRGALDGGGKLSLVVPDKRFTFDFRRNSSTLGEMVEAYLMKYRMPSIRQMFDHCADAVVVDKAEAWRRDLSNEDLPKIVGDQYALPLAWQQALEISHAPRYIDSHCWIFTPASFLKRMDELAQLQLLPFRVSFFETTNTGENEFFVHLTPCPCENTEEIRASIREIAARI